MNKLGMLLASAVLLTSVASVQVHAADNLDITKTPYPTQYRNQLEFKHNTLV